MLCIFSVVIIFSFNSAYAQDVEEGPTTTELIILFLVAILFVAGIIIYITREIIMRKKNRLRQGKF